MLLTLPSLLLYSGDFWPSASALDERAASSSQNNEFSPSRDGRCQYSPFA